MSVGFDEASVSTKNFAVIFRTHFWDEFASRQLDRLLKVTRNGDVYILVDETKGRVEGINHDKIVRVTEQDCLNHGFVAAGEGAMLWFNGDYPLYHFRKLQPSYRYYLQLEYDVVFNADLDVLMQKISADNMDFVGLTKGEPPLEWTWLSTCRGWYNESDIRHQLICVSIFSGRALDYLARRRLELSNTYRNGESTTWPMCEGFIATEMFLSGLQTTELSRYGSTDAYDWWPPFVEADLPELSRYPFIHPVLDQNRYISSVLKYPVGLRSFFRPNSIMHKKLRRLPLRVYLGTIISDFCKKLIRNCQPSAVKRRFS